MEIVSIKGVKHLYIYPRAFLFLPENHLHISLSPEIVASQ